MEEIPQDVWNEIFLYLPLPDLLPIGFTSSEWCHSVLEIFPDQEGYSEDNLIKLDKQLYPCTSVELVQWWSTFHKPCVAEFRRIYLLNHSELLESSKAGLLEMGCDRDLLRSVTEGGHLESLRWINQVFGPGQIPKENWFSATGGAAAQGRIQILEFLLHREGGRLMVAKNLKHAAANGQIHVIEWSIQQGFDKEIPGIERAAINGGQLDLLKWLQAHGRNVQSAICNRSKTIMLPRAVDDESAVQLMEDFVRLGAKPNQFSLAQMIRQGYKESITYLLRAKVPWTVGDSVKCLVAPIDRNTPRAMVEAEYEGKADSILYLYNEVGLTPCSDRLFVKSGDPRKRSLETLRNGGYPIDDMDVVELNLMFKTTHYTLHHFEKTEEGDFHVTEDVEENLREARRQRITET
ncbi:hypothetical protein PROFUN_01095 [Planoprotostelium fungivorum]|uniref:F-box domain-containing protein n=1 Tax=Planoprotostelium fungivorum TaxID=1890364 RepID=A0A2P6NCC1_9EUKA|nr:hypothetical protein PROFUN_01095 [Planoprotostelium fungivorum]